VSFELRGRRAPGARAAAVLLEQMKDAAGGLEHTSGLDLEEAIHEARKGLKKCRAVLRLARSSIGPVYGEGNSQLRDIGRSLSEVRDAPVLVSTLDELVADRRLGPPRPETHRPTRVLFVYVPSRRVTSRLDTAMVTS